VGLLLEYAMVYVVVRVAWLLDLDAKRLNKKEGRCTAVACARRWWGTYHVLRLCLSVGRCNCAL
jgi:hypothetical protein